MTQEQILVNLLQIVEEILFEIDPAAIDSAKTLKELGASSIERADILMETLDKIGLRVPALRLREVAGSPLGEVAAVFARWQAEAG
jgi:acyl carrier protein